MQNTYQNCPLCSQSFKTLARHNITQHALWHSALPEEIEWCECESCKHIFTKNYWDAEGLEQVFINANESQLATTNLHNHRVTWAPTIERALRLAGGYKKLMHQPNPPKWLDVGFGNGALVATSSEFGFHATGLDARTEAVERLKAIGYNAICQTFEDFTPEPFTIISMCDVLEHIPHPRPALKKAKHMLEPDGVLVISMPNTDSAHWRTMDIDKINPYWIELEHHHNFSRLSLENLLNEEGFEIVEYAISPRYLACMEVFAKHN